jgi:hypothetical protein
MPTEREREAALAGRKWAEDKAAALEGTSSRDWPDEWDAAWSGELHLEPHRPALIPEELAALMERATEAARERWEEILEAERSVEESSATESEFYASALRDVLRGHVPDGLSVGREGARVYLQDVADATEMTVTSYAHAARAISDWQERHFGR